MEHQNEYQQEYHEELQKVQDRDFTYNWVSSSAFLFYLQVACILALMLGGCYKLYEKRYKGKPDVVVPENTLYTPKYK
jgi:G:T-mismatch repair DNA endonuclease (very short patch repair protein)